jgi:hypothetical protein
MLPQQLLKRMRYPVSAKTVEGFVSLAQEI